MATQASQSVPAFRHTAAARHFDVWAARHGKNTAGKGDCKRKRSKFYSGEWAKHAQQVGRRKRKSNARSVQESTPNCAHNNFLRRNLQYFTKEKSTDEHKKYKTEV